MIMQANTPGPAQGSQNQVDVDPIIAKVQQSIPPQLKDIYDKAVLSGMRIMFDSQSHQMMLDALDQPGPLATRISNGIIQLMYLLWTQSNKTLPPQIIVPVTLTLTLKAFDFLQKSGEPDATKQVLGDATQQAVEGIMSRFGVKGMPQEGAPASGDDQGATAQPPQASAPQGAGMLDSIGGQ
jgi:hypothetical protein